MADDPQHDEDAPQEQQPQTGEQLQQARAMQNVGQGRELDASSVQDAMSRLKALDEAGKAQQAAEAERLAQLAKVEVKKEDVELVMNEFEIRRDEADLALRENGGNVINAIRALLVK